MGGDVFLVKSFILRFYEIISSFNMSKAESTGFHFICYDIMFVLSGSKPCPSKAALIFVLVSIRFDHDTRTHAGI